ncbi:hypothetical protein [Nocardia macrotermitis]|uniref:Uncharacterized protein n=1 Tax=Nocardia macrotermitis TaxID=2585198 RepID=A0A7K0CY58_9NOCA|nr:hypothetical protein [Nocardia macrotermitis]MQY18348.1 hypothetical protein [Nocardia macrotermitis]
MDQENGPKPGLFSHSTVTAATTPANATAEAKAQRPVFSSGPNTQQAEPTDGEH